MTKENSGYAHVGLSDTASELTAAQRDAAKDVLLEHLPDIIESLKEVIGMLKTRDTSGVLERKVSKTPIDNAFFAADWRLGLSPNNPIRRDAEENGDIIEIGSPRDYANTAAALAIVDAGIAAEEAERKARVDFIC